MPDGLAIVKRFDRIAAADDAAFLDPAIEAWSVIQRQIDRQAEKLLEVLAGEIKSPAWSGSMSGLPAALLVSAMKAPRVVRALNIMAILLAGFLLAASHAASGESGNISDTVDANALTQQAIELEKQGRYSEAVPLAQRALALYEKALGRIILMLPQPYTILPNFIEGKRAMSMLSPCSKGQLRSEKKPLDQIIPTLLFR
jgi:hypothetical protein